MEIEEKRDTSETNYQLSSPGLSQKMSLKSSRAPSPKLRIRGRGAPEDEFKKYRISKNSVRNSFRKPEDPNIEDLHKAKLRLSAHLNMSLIHRGGRTSARFNETSKLRLKSKESVASFDSTRT